MRILITGSKGQLGSELKVLSNYYPEHLFFHTDKEELDITSKEAIVKFVNKNKIKVIINCAAYTAVDRAESEKELADRINHLAVKNLAELAKEKTVKLIHISTDYVFDGKGYKPYPVGHPTSPVNTYGITKLAGEKAMQLVQPSNSIIIRTSWVYSSYGNNFVKTMMRLGEDRNKLNVICDQIGVPTYARDLADFILQKAVYVENNKVGLYHFTNEGVCSWYDFAKEIMGQAELKCKVCPIPATAYPSPAIRPYYSLMDKVDINKEFNYTIPYWKESLKECIEKLTFNLH
ncbi:dTDP-4-dehydrorhamnose reductase [Psychroflexus sp. CAK57W]|uniref:dTDP-4-dehydrorhamnose reductase n=1 Tax=Psychroflexus curvus TaxID=2873595 RepID=UPI001CC9AB33|nr:dTDP-4-dehydrorhamnose reductase [Psychroflexus curvus]MBZ9786738.1 dTDP-4-dehydrorhamnose reductase [Psychroflexus curvus]